MLIELYQCDFVPSLVPEFVDPHITVDQNLSGKEIYLFEVNPNHPDAKAVKKSGKTIKEVLEMMGFVKVVHHYTGERPY